MTIRVDLSGGRGYEVRVGASELGACAEAVRAGLGSFPRSALLVFDANVPNSFQTQLAGLCAEHGTSTTSVTIDPSEKMKSIETWQRLLGAMAQAKLDRSDAVFALGGGIVGDIAGFAAASYRRGIPVVQFPTTLLAMVDASVGGKTGVNLDRDGSLLKNFVGAFWQPRLVVADIDTLASLEPRDFRCGLAECVKHAMLSGHTGDEGLAEWIDAHAEGLLARDSAFLTELVRRSVEVKRWFVERDEQESPEADWVGRAALNLGHTFGHAIETIGHLAPAGHDAPLRHGEAVALGLVCASRASASLGIIDDAEADTMVARLDRLGLPTAITGLPPSDEIIARMGDDKKSIGGVARVVLPHPGHEVALHENPDPGALAAGIRAIRADA